MSEDLRIKVILDPDTSKLDKAVNNVGNGPGNGNTGGTQQKGPVANSLDQAAKLESKLKTLTDAQRQLAAQPGMERNLAKVNQELAGVYGRYKSLAKDSGAYLSNLQKEVELRKQASQLTNQANKNEGVYSAHSDRQYAMLQQIAGRVPGGGIFNKFLGGARSSAMASEAGGGSGSMMSGGALAGGAMAAVAGAATVAVAALAQKLGEMGSRAQELSQSASSATSSLGQLRSQIEQTGIRKDMNAVSGGVTVAGINQWKEQTGDSIVGGFFDAITGKSPQQKQADVNQAISQGLGGDDKEQWRRIKEHGQDVQIDLARQKQGIDIQQQRTNRDFALEQKSWAIDVANQKFDLQKQAQRQEQDYQISKKQFDENWAGQMAQRQFDLQQKYAKQGYEIQRQRAQEDFQIQQGYKKQDYEISRQRAQQDYSIARSDKAYDFGVSQSRNKTEFDINRTRQGEDFQESIQKMMLSGNVDPISLFFASKDYRKEQKRQLEDFNRQKEYATQDYNVSQARDLRSYNLSQGRAAQDYQIGVGRDTQQYQLSQSRAAQDFSIQQQQAREQRQLQLDDMAYQRKYQGLELELQHNRNLEDSAIAFQRLNQAVGLQAERFGNQAKDISVDQALQNRDYGITAYRTLRDYGYQQQDYAGAMRDKNPLGAYGQSLTDPTFADALNRNAAATGKLPLDQQIKQAQSGLDWGNVIGQALGQSIPFFGPFGLGSSAGSVFGGPGSDKLTGLGPGSPIVPGVLPPGMGLGGLGGQLGAPVNNYVFNAGNPTFNGGMSAQDQSMIDAHYQDLMMQMQNDMMNFMQRLQSGSLGY